MDVLTLDPCIAVCVGVWMASCPKLHAVQDTSMENGCAKLYPRLHTYHASSLTFVQQWLDCVLPALCCSVARRSHKGQALDHLRATPGDDIAVSEYQRRLSPWKAPTLPESTPLVFQVHDSAHVRLPSATRHTQDPTSLDIGWLSDVVLNRMYLPPLTTFTA